VLDLDAAATVRDAYATITQDCASQIVAFESGARERKPEALHKMRVGVRRLRSSLNLFKPAIVEDRVNGLVADLKWLQHELGQARDLDVFIERTLLPLREVVREHHDAADINILIDAASKHSTRAYDAVIGTITSDRYMAMRQSVQTLIADEQHGEGDSTRSKWQERSAAAFADFTLRKRTKKLAKMGNDIARLDDAGLHELRKQCKKLRYGIEFFSPFYRKKTTHRYLHDLVALQDTIGYIVDVGAAGALLARLNPGKGKQPSKDTLAAIERSRALVSGWMLARSQSYHEHLEELWSDFATTLQKKSLF
jgi:CHAD domain-containing protein